MSKKSISIVTPCYNEQDNVELLYTQVKEIFDGLENYEYEHIFIDNDSQDKTLSLLENMARKDLRVKIIVNARNFGFVRSLYHGLLQGTGDAVVLIFADLQDPPTLIIDFLQRWEQGYQVVKGIKISSQENTLVYSIRRFYYYLVSVLAEEVELTSNFTGFGLYDKQVIEALRLIDDPYPYLKGLISEVGFKSAKIEYHQKVRKRGKSSFNFYRMYDLAMLGITTYSNFPLRLATMIGFALSLLSFLVGLVTLILKLLFWNLFPIGTAAIIVGLFLFSSVQLFFIGILGEYIGLINRRSLKRPLVVERKRVNFERK
ncbi:MAG: glycosyltransferase family 2 protein [Microcystis aeruginosa G11-01]|jgi:glycosyltransferase involved in cell wall biosynthesis|nr:glycosyltransferase family 2 protein [Microcystis aeruginosa G13-10]NCS33811.1 glycosyltransferase family 2 protein [Microcystis aeruginosa G11-01]